MSRRQETRLNRRNNDSSVSQYGGSRMSSIVEMSFIVVTNDRIELETKTRRPGSRELVRHGVRYPLLTDSDDILLNLPDMSALTNLTKLSISAHLWVNKTYTLNTQGLCSVHSLKYLRLENLIVLIDDPKCIALPNLRTVNISTCTFGISPDLPYTNVLEMFSEYSPDIERITISITNMEGSIPASIVDLQKLSYLRLSSNWKLTVDDALDLSDIDTVDIQ